MTRDEAIKYNALYQEIELAISNIHNLGFDTTEFVRVLREIHNRVNDNVKVKYVRGMAEASYIQSYSNGINELNKLKNRLDNYDVYVKAYNTCNYINIKLNKDISKEEMAKCVSQMIYTMKSIFKSSTIDYDDEKHIIEKIYKTAYNIIKLGIITDGESQLYQFAKKEDVNISYFNNLVLKDIEGINLGENTNIKTKIYELGVNGIYSNYFDLELIKLIIISTKEADLKGIITDKIKTLCNEILESDKEIRKNYCLVDIEEDKKKLALINLNKLKKEYKKRLTSLILSASIITSGFVSIPFISKGLSKNHEYIYTGYTYSSVSDDYEKKEYFTFSFGETDHFTNVYLDTYSKKDDNFRERLDIGYLELEDIYAYINYVKELYDELIRDDDTYYKVEMKNYQKTTANSFPWIMTICLYVFYLVCLLFYCGVTLLDPFDVDKIKKLKKEMEEGTTDLNEILTVIDEYLEKIITKVNEDDALREKFMQLYNDNLFLLQDSDELLRRINLSFEMNKIDQVKKYVREKER